MADSHYDLGSFGLSHRAWVRSGRSGRIVRTYVGKLLPRVSCTTRPVERSVYEGVLRYPFAQKLRLQNSYVVEV